MLTTSVASVKRLKSSHVTVLFGPLSLAPSLRILMWSDEVLSKQCWLFDRGGGSEAPSFLARL